MNYATILVKPSSYNCNIACRYCFYRYLGENNHLDGKMMKEDTLEQLIRQGIDYADREITFAFQGGEPTLCGLDFFRKAVELEKRFNHKNIVIHNSLQTNGLLLDEQWCEFFRQNDFTIGLSLDGPDHLHDENRVYKDDQKTFEKVLEAAGLLKRHGVYFDILTVVTDNTCNYPGELYEFYKKHDFTHVHLIPCLDEIEGKSFAPDARHYGEFLNGFFSAWFEDFKKGYRMDVRFFNNLLMILMGQYPEQCGTMGQCSCYMVVEADGSVYPCDFYCQDKYLLGDIKEGFVNLKAKKIAEEFVTGSRYDRKECLECPYFGLCHGGCRRYREPFISDKPGKYVLCEAYKMFFDKHLNDLRRLASYILRISNGL